MGSDKFKKPGVQDDNTGDEKYSIPSLERMIKILEYLSGEQTSKNVTEISNVLGYPKNSVFRITRTMLSHGYLEEDNKRFLISPKFFSLAYRSLRKRNLFIQGHEVMLYLREETNETVLLGSLYGNSITVLEVLPSFQFIRLQVEPGHNVELHASAPGKAILAFLPENKQEELMNHMSFKRFTDTTIPTKNVMREQIKIIRAKGYAVDEGEELPDIHCIASPIFDYHNQAIASVWISGPAYRIGREKFDNLGKVVFESAMKISKRLGFSPEFSGFPEFNK
jgi:DNA-binding IclR family transcriptional regulator